MPKPASFEFQAMGSKCVLLLFAPSHKDASQAAAAAIGEVHRIERTYSRYQLGNVTHAINAAGEAGGTVEVDSETADLIDISFEAYSLSEGLFDITSGALREVWNGQTKQLPAQDILDGLLARIGLQKVLWHRPVLSFTRPLMQIDLGGIGKEYAADRAAEACRAHVVNQGMVNLGGDISIVGPRPDGEPWRIGVNNPKAPENVMATLFTHSGGVATSGDYIQYREIEGRRYSHILNPITGWPARNLSSVTVGAQSCLIAGIYSTIAMLKGEAGAQWLREQGVPHIFANEDGEVDLTGIQSA